VQGESERPGRKTDFTPGRTITRRYALRSFPEDLGEEWPGESDGGAGRSGEGAGADCREGQFIGSRWSSWNLFLSRISIRALLCANSDPGVAGKLIRLSSTISYYNRTVSGVGAIDNLTSRKYEKEGYRIC